MQNEFISIKLQDGPIKEAGINGCQIDEVVEFCRDKIVEFNKLAPCRENALVITKLEEALHWLDHRTKDRERRQVEGTSKA